MIIGLRSEELRPTAAHKLAGSAELVSKQLLVTVVSTAAAAEMPPIQSSKYSPGLSFGQVVSTMRTLEHRLSFGEAG